MSLSYYDERTKPRTKIAMALVALNAAIAFGISFYWSGLATVIGEPYKWAMRGSISPSPSLFEYPYLAAWLTPLLCVVAGWLAVKGGRPKAGQVIGLYPALMLAIMVGWYYLTPNEWH